MPSKQLADPLKRFPVFRTSDSEEFRNVLLTRFGASKAEVKQPSKLRARGSLVQLENISLVYGYGSSGVEPGPADQRKHEHRHARRGVHPIG